MADERRRRGEVAQVCTSPAGRVLYRKIRPSDWNELQRFHARLSSRSQSLRFHAAKCLLSEPLARRLSGVDGCNEVAIVATTANAAEAIVGVARYARIDESTAELAVVVEDGWQGHGLGTELIRRLKHEATTVGITALIAEVLADNGAMLHILAQLGGTTVRLDGAIDRVALNLER